jgi:integrase
LLEIEFDLRQGTFISPDAGKITFRRYADAWLASTTHDELTHNRIELEFRLHVYPAFGDMPISVAAQPATIRAWAKRIQDAGLSAGYRRVIFTDVSQVFSAAVDDRKIPSNPFGARSIRRPKTEMPEVTPWSGDQRAKFRANLAERYRITVDLGAGCGLRQGEIFAVSPDDIDRGRKILRVSRQVKVVRGRLIFALPKEERSARSRYRTP